MDKKYAPAEYTYKSFIGSSRENISPQIIKKCIVNFPQKAGFIE